MWNKVPTVEDFSVDVYEFLERFSLEPNHQNPHVTQPKRKKKITDLSEEDQIALALRQSLGKAEESEFEEDSDIEIVEPPNGKGKTVTCVDTDDEEVQEAPAPVPDAIEEVNDDEDESEDAAEERLFAQIPKHTEPEPEQNAGSVTRIQLRLADGSRIVRRFNTTDKVATIFGVVKATVESVGDSYFSLSSERKKLITMLDKTIEEAGLKNSSILVEILD